MRNAKMRNAKMRNAKMRNNCGKSNKIEIRTFCVSVLLLIFSSVAAAQKGTDKAHSAMLDGANSNIRPTIAYVGATLIDGNGGPAIPGSVIIESEGTIINVGLESELELPPNTQVVDVGGRWIIPGLIESHAHFYESQRYQWMYRAIQAALSKEELAQEMIWVRDRLPYTLTRYLCAGVTTAVSLAGPDQIEFRAKKISNSSESVSPRIFVSGKLIDNIKPFEVFLGETTTSRLPKDPDDARAMVRERYGQGVDLIKLAFTDEENDWATPPITNELALPMLRAAAEEARSLGLPVIIHIMTLNGAHLLVDSGLNAFAHMPFDKPIDDGLIQKLLENNVAVATTSSIIERRAAVINDELQLEAIEKACADPEVLQNYKDLFVSAPKDALEKTRSILNARREPLAKLNKTNIRKLVASGVRLVASTDAGHVGLFHGAGLHVEMVQLEERFGMQPSEIIVSATKNASISIQKDKKIGTIEQGKLADFLILRSDPLITIRNAQDIESIVKGGRVFKREHLEASKFGINGSGL